MRRPGRKAPLGEPEIGDPNHSYAYAITLLARRDYSSRELTGKLEERGYLEHAIVPVVEELLAMKVLSMTDLRLQDRIDAQRLLQLTPELDLSLVREHLARIRARGYAREQDLEAKLTLVLRDVGRVAR